MNARSECYRRYIAGKHCVLERHVKYIVVAHEARTVVIVVPRVFEMIHGRIMKTIKSGKGKDVQKIIEGQSQRSKIYLNVSRTLLNRL